ncbi:hypothetical protein, partial [Caenimonas sp. SL110]|uniref:hypothetical protein n=1 Tax=Caenimonas sp. SL110 TaxID=1450524 RepID=UPI001872CE66
MKAFDIDFVGKVESAKLDGLDPDYEPDIRKAVREVLAPEFVSYLPASQERMVESLRTHLADEGEDFSALFNRISLTFGRNPRNARWFMTIVLEPPRISWRLFGLSQT